MGRNRVRNNHHQSPCSDRPWTVEQVVQVYLLNRARDVERGLLAPRTLRDYRWVLEQLVERFGHFLVHELRPSHIVEWVNERPTWRKDSQIASVYRRVKACFSWWSRLYSQPNPVAGIKVPLCRPRPPIRPDEFARILSAARTAHLKCVLMFLWLTGARPSEVCRIRKADVLNHGELHYVCMTDHKTAKKTGKARIIVLGPKGREVVRRSIALSPTNRAHVFVTPRGHPWSVDWLSRQFALCRAIAGIREDVTLYSIRHAAALRAYQGGCDSKSIADYLGTSQQMLDRHYLSQSLQVVLRLRQVAEVLESE